MLLHTVYWYSTYKVYMYNVYRGTGKTRCKGMYYPLITRYTIRHTGGKYFYTNITPVNWV